MLTRPEVLEFVRGYCKVKGIPLERAKEQLLVTGTDFATFCVSNPNAPEPDGLKNDIDTLMLPTLYVRKTRDGLTIEETPYTDKFFIKAAS